MVFEITGARERTAAVSVDERGRGALVEPPAEPTARIGLDWEDYIRLAAGRCDAAEVKAAVEGDTELAERVLRNMAVTP